eukprot:TRINITY_DN793_c0_g1_i2.p3 TRINITY_DN793_c0_g1~~TRINITY_DN793_c0_g1_i2.p3  ORF type:complete len:224 (-),score=-17.77 TRINITY_DN793_c0_g1_i2:558-1229(-)
MYPTSHIYFRRQKFLGNFQNSYIAGSAICIKSKKEETKQNNQHMHILLLQRIFLHLCQLVYSAIFNYKFLIQNNYLERQFGLWLISGLGQFCDFKQVSFLIAKLKLTQFQSKNRPSYWNQILSFDFQTNNQIFWYKFKGDPIATTSFQLKLDIIKYLNKFFYDIQLTYIYIQVRSRASPGCPALSGAPHLNPRVARKSIFANYGTLNIAIITINPSIYQPQQL